MRHRLFYLLFRGAMALFGILPEPVALALGRIAGWLYRPFAGGRKVMALRHMRRVLGKGAVAERAATEMFTNYGRYWAEVLWVRRRRLGAVRAQTIVEGGEHLQAAFDAGSGAIVALPHVGNWEVAGPVAGEHGFHLVAVAEELPNRHITSWFVRLRRDFGIEVVHPRRGVTRRLEEVLRAGGMVALLCDRDLNGRGVEVEFFGEKTTLPAGPLALARRTGAAVLPVGSFFSPGRGHRLVVRPPISVVGPDPEHQGIKKLADALEELVRMHPEQWHLLQPNWPSDRSVS